MPSDLDALLRVKNVGQATLAALRAAGFTTLEELSQATISQLTQVPGIGSATARAILDDVQGQNQSSSDPVQTYRYDEKRKNNPPAGLAAQGKVEKKPAVQYSYDPHLPPALRFDSTGQADGLPELLQTARTRALTAGEAQMLAGALQQHQPWLEWTGKREQRWFEVDPVALHIHERVSAEAVVRLARRQPVQRGLFADPELEYREAVKFYQHDIDWANRLILGDSLVVMSSLARREDLAGKVQMIYIDPPYGIKFASNFQAEVGRRDVKDKEEDLTREPEQIKAYRDTWTLGIHSYLAYLRDRLTIARELLADSGSIFVQISDMNVHRVRLLLDEVFGPDNAVATIAYKKASPETSTIRKGFNYLLWFCRDINKMKEVHKLYNTRELGVGTTEDPKKLALWLQMPDGFERTLTTEEKREEIELPKSAAVFRADKVRDTAQANDKNFKFDFKDEELWPGTGFNWRGYPDEMNRLAKADRLVRTTETLAFKFFFSDSGGVEITSMWEDTAGKIPDMQYVVQTHEKVITRCMLMTTDPGDLVLDPTCGSGTTAYVAEQLGRRWITIDTSRVASALARQRLLTAKYDYYELLDPKAGLAGNFVYKTVPHVTLKSIAQNQALDPIFAQWEPVLVEKLTALNQVLATHVTPDLRTRLQAKLVAKERAAGKSAITDADRRRWLLPKERWQEWEVPFDTDPDWPEALQTALTAYRSAWRQKMDEVNACIAANAPPEKLVDQPQLVKGIIRVSGPFTVEGVQPPEQTLDLEASPISGAPETLDTFPATTVDPTNADAHISNMIRLLRQDGVRFPDNKEVKFTRLEPLTHSHLHAEGEWETAGEPRRVAVSFGPQYGPITAKQVEDCLRAAHRGGYDDMLFAGFTIDGAAQAAIQDDPNPRVRSHMAYIRPDVNMGGLLKETPSSQLFTVFGLPRVSLEKNREGEYIVEMEGVDIYDPATNTVTATRAEKVAAWFLDGDYDGRTFCITQAFFPDRTAWDKLARALKSVVDPDLFGAFSGTRSLPFPAGAQQRAAVKVIDPRGNEVMRILQLEDGHHA